MVTAPQLYFHIKNIFENNRIENPQFEAMCVVEHIFRKKLGTLLLEKRRAATVSSGGMGVFRSAFLCRPRSSYSKTGYRNAG